MRLSLKSIAQADERPAADVQPIANGAPDALEIDGFDLGFLARNAQVQRPPVVVTARAVKPRRLSLTPPSATEQ